MNIDEDWRSGRRHMVKEGIKKLFEQETENNANNNNFILDEVLINLETQNKTLPKYWVHFKPGCKQIEKLDKNFARFCKKL